MIAALTALLLAQSYPLMANGVITANGSRVVPNLASAEVDLTVDLTGSANDAGANETVTFCLTPVDPGSTGTALTGDARAQCGTLAGPGQLALVLGPVRTTAAQVSWTVAGTSPYFSGVNLTLKSVQAPTPSGVDQAGAMHPLSIDSFTGAQRTEHANLPTLSQVSTYTNGESSYDSVAGDFNNDGVTDLLVTNYSGSDVSVYIGKGNGTFKAPISVGVPSGPRLAAVGDFNNDGCPDFAVTNRTTTIGIELGHCDGTFSAGTPLTATAAVQGIAAGVLDFSSNNVSIIVAQWCISSCTGANAINLFTGNGNATFSAAIPYVGPNNPWQIALADLNGDGALDLVAAANWNTSGAILGLLFGTGSEAFGAMQSASLTGYTGTGVAVADFNGDGIPDIAVTDGSNVGTQAGGVEVFLGNPSGSNFYTATVPSTFYSIQTNSNTANTQGIAVADFNGDGFIDIAAAVNTLGATGNGTVILANDGHGRFYNSSLIVGGALPNNGGAPYFAVGDFNQDGLPDIPQPNFFGGTGIPNLFLFLSSAVTQVVPTFGASWQVSAQVPLPVWIVDGGSGGGGGGAVTQSGNWAELMVYDGGPLPVSGTVAATQSGSWNVGINGVVPVSIVDGGAPAVQAVSIVDGGVGATLAATTATVFAAATTATATHTSGVITGLSAYGSLIFEVDWSGITGAPLTCKFQVQTDVTTTMTNWGPTIALTPSASTTQLVYPNTWPGPLGPNAQVVYSCGTYPTGGTMTVTVGASAQVSSGVAISDNTNGPVAVKAASTAAAATDPSLVVQLSTNTPSNTNAWIVQGKTATTTAVTNPIMGAARATGDAAAPTAGTTGDQETFIGDIYGRQMVQTWHPNHWSCNLSGISTQVQCEAAPGAGLSLYLTDIILSSAGAATVLIVDGTGTNCGTGTATIQGTDTMATGIPLPIAFQTPIKLPANTALCCQPSATTTCTFNGFTAP